ncbi:MAG: hypothetical protein AAB393_11795, partial [Bacteroidota bacterium]
MHPQGAALVSEDDFLLILVSANLAFALRRRGVLPSGAALLTALLLSAVPCRPAASGAGIWMFDFRDTFYDVEFLKG